MTDGANDMLERLEGKTYIIGREGHIYIKDPAASKQHAELSFVDGRIRIRDLGSTNGIYILRDGQAMKLEDEYVDPQQTIAIGKEKHKIESLVQTIWSFTI
jgi:pSer/pThr/pTyr-binding forkhead associated (FHA) protein